MQRELYFDISSEHSGGSLFRIQENNGSVSFYYSYSRYDPKKDEVKVFEKNYPDFEAFWNELTRDPQWWYLHPMFVHPEQREFVRGQLQQADWSVHPDRKWQESHQRQWKKVLTGPANYYTGPPGGPAKPRQAS